MLSIRNGRVVGIPQDFPSGFEVAVRFVEYVTNNLERFRLRYRCVIKVTTVDAKRFLRESGLDIDAVSPASLSGYLTSIMIHFERLMIERGFRLIERKGHRNSTARYFAIPNCGGQ